MAAWTIDELASRVGLTVRHLREFHSKGLTPPPRLVGRKGFYGVEHETRIALIRRLQDRGYGLKGIQDLLQQWQDGGGVEAPLERAIVGPPKDGVGAAELQARLPELFARPALVKRARALGLVDVYGDTVFAPSAELVEFARAALAAGYPMDAVLDELAALRAEAAQIGDRFRENFERYVMKPAHARGFQAHEVPRIAALIATMRQVGVRALSTCVMDNLEQGGGKRG